MDLLDKKILAELLKNSRIPITQLSKRVRSSREVVNYRIERMVNSGIIIKFITNINTDLLGFISGAVFLNIRMAKEEEFKKFIKSFEFLSWGGTFSGAWRMGIDIYGRDNVEIDANFNKIFTKFKSEILTHRLAIYKAKYFMHEKYFGYNNLERKTFHSVYTPDEIDKQILSLLSENSRIDTISIASKLKLSAPAIAKRIKNLENNKFILRYSLFLDISKLGLFQYSIFIINNEEKDKLVTYLKVHPKVNFIAEYIGDPFLEFGLFVDDSYKLRTLLQQIEESFPNNRIHDVFLIQNEFLSIGPPKCVFG
jgi:DNA-binding Lrp family transcriptional regulator